MHVSMITRRVDVYRSRPIGASLLAGRGRPGADADRYRCACLTQGLAGRGDGISAASTGGVLVNLNTELSVPWYRVGRHFVGSACKCEASVVHLSPLTVSSSPAVQSGNHYRKPVTAYPRRRVGHTCETTRVAR